MKKIFLLFIIFCFQCFYLSAQERNIANQFNTWITASGNHKIADKFSLHTLISQRQNKFVKHKQQSLIRVGVNYHLKPEISFSLGYDWAKTFQYGEQPIAKDEVEQRLYGQFQVKQKIGRIGLKHYYRLENRFIDLGDNRRLRHRFRYRFGMNIPLNKPTIEEKTVFLSFFNELFISVGNSTHPNYFNQNWTYGGVAYRIDDNKIASLGYMNQYLPKGTSELVESNHTLMISYSQNLDFTKKKK